MKKLLTLFMALGAFVAVQAQTSKEEARRVILGGGKSGSGNTGTTSKSGRDVILGGGNNTGNYPTYPNSYPNGGSRDAQVDQINREYDQKIWSIRNNNQLSQAEKERIIRQLENDRARRIREVNNSYGRDRDYDDDDDYRGSKSNNGKHKGWEKGVGNPHKNGGHPGKGKNKGYKS